MNKFLITKRIFITISIAGAIALYFIFYALFGEKGIVKYFQLKKELHGKEMSEGVLEYKKEIRQNMVDGMSSDSLDLDMLDEKTRKDLGYAGKNEIVIYKEHPKTNKK
ncbi:MAG: cell division protein FtsB [Rickettsiales bacterium]